MLFAQRHDGAVLLERRPERGIWGGLWCPPQFPSVEAAQLFAATRLQAAEVDAHAHGIVRHAFTHFELEISPLYARCKGWGGVMDSAQALWYNPAQPERLGLPAPVTTMLQSLTHKMSDT